ncbi:MAG: BA14K family protein [Roseibium sp.]
MSYRKAVLTALAAGLAYVLPAPALAATANFAPFPALSAEGELPVLRVDHRRSNGKRGYHGRKKLPYYNGHRGYRDYRRGYRRHSGWWFPPGAFSPNYRVIPPQRYNAAPPLVIVPRTHAPAPRYAPYLSPAHYRWCNRRYRSYRTADNSFQPYQGPRRACVSPYGP